MLHRLLLQRTTSPLELEQTVSLNTKDTTAGLLRSLFLIMKCLLNLPRHADKVKQKVKESRRSKVTE